MVIPVAVEAEVVVVRPMWDTLDEVAMDGFFIGVCCERWDEMSPFCYGVPCLA